MQIDKVEDFRLRYERRQGEIKALALLWKSLLPKEFLPAGRQFSIWLDRYGFELTEKGIRQTAVKFNIVETKAKKQGDRSLSMNQDYCIRYASGVMVNCLKQRREVNPCLND